MPTLSAAPYDDPRAAVLIEAMADELSARYGDGGLSPALPGDFEPPGVLLLVEADGVAVACGGLRRLEPGCGEIKRMYVDPAVRGRGTSRLLLRALLDHARVGGLSRVVLETGTEQPEAIGLYESEGFTPVPAYGHYRADPRTRCYGLDLAS